jgi:hypothetical protein
MPPPPEWSPTAQAIYDHYARKYNAEPARHYLGGSAIGNPCERALWYSFRWAVKREFDGRMHRLFQRGHREEPIFVADMRDIGYTVWDRNPKTGKQWSWSEASLGHHFAGNGDGIVKGVIQAPKAPHIWECKTHSTKSFNEVQSKGVQIAKPMHYAQMQIYMHWTIAEFGKTHGCQRALYTAICKENDAIHDERVRYDEQFALGLVAKAKRIIFAKTPLPKLSLDSSWYECKLCDYHAVCHGDAVPQATCRTCVHATPEPDGNARWTCNQVDESGVAATDIPIDIQRIGCEYHRLLPPLLSNWADAIDAEPHGDWIKYRIKATGAEFCNGFPPEALTSAEIASATDKRALTDKGVQEFRDVFQAEIAG